MEAYAASGLTQRAFAKREERAVESQAEQKLREDLRGGAVFVFVNKDRDRLKMLYWDGIGVRIFAKRLERGRFTWSTGSDRTNRSLAPEALAMLMAGIDLKDGCCKAWYERWSSQSSGMYRDL